MNHGIPVPYLHDSSVVQSTPLRIGWTTLLVATVCLGVSGAGAAAQQPASFRSTSQDRTDVSITVYNQDFGLVREVRDVELATGLGELEFRDVASEIQTETVHVTSLTDPDALEVLEQNFRYDLLTPSKLLEAYVGRSVTLHREDPDTGTETTAQAEVLSVNEGVVLRVDGRVTYGVEGRFSFPEVPESLIPRPTLVWLIDSRRATQRIEVSYLAGRLNWTADYVLVVNEDDTEGDLTGWVTLTNQSGATYEDARLKLVAGDVRRVSGGRDRGREGVLIAPTTFEERGFDEEAFFEYHLYTLGRPTTVRDNEEKQVTLLEASAIDLEKRFVFRGSAGYFRDRLGRVVRNQSVAVLLELSNSASSGLGMPLPRGVVRVYKEDGSGAQQFVGEDRIDHTPRDERFRIRVGEAFDVVADRRQTDYSVVGRCVSESAWEIDLRNHKDEDVVVEVIEPAGGDWELLRSSHPAEELDAGTFRFDVAVPSDGRTTVDYRIRVTTC